jgi:methylphosphotriester-DNA--protein-cysteine methyltransferase
VASKTGKKYHLPWCTGAKNIPENNKIWFNSIDEAKKAGYTPALNCKGLK